MLTHFCTMWFARLVPRRLGPGCRKQTQPSTLVPCPHRLPGYSHPRLGTADGAGPGALPRPSRRPFPCTEPFSTARGKPVVVADGPCPSSCGNCFPVICSILQLRLPSPFYISCAGSIILPRPPTHGSLALAQGLRFGVPGQ